MGATCLVVVLLVAANTAHADGLFFKLPKDGTWATYQMDLAVKGGSQELRRKGTVRVASVGQVEENSQLCRWIEVLTEDRDVEKDVPPDSVVQPARKDVLKFLIPEKFLKQGETPQDHVLRAWKGGLDGKPEKASGPWPFLVGPPKDAKHLDKVEVKSKLGKLMCEGVVGSLEIGTPGESKAQCLMENRLHGDAPFGVVSTHWTSTIISVNKPKDGSVPQENGKVELNLKLIDFGDKAVSEMPDAK